MGAGELGAAQVGGLQAGEGIGQRADLDLGARPGLAGAVVEDRGLVGAEFHQAAEVGVERAHGLEGHTAGLDDQADVGIGGAHLEPAGREHGQRVVGEHDDAIARLLEAEVATEDEGVAEGDVERAEDPEAELGRVDVEGQQAAEHAVQAGELGQLDPEQAQVQPGQLDLGQLEEELQHVELGPVDVHAREGELAELQIRPVRQQAAEVEPELQALEFEPRQGEQELRHRQVRPVDLQAGEGRGQVGQADRVPVDAGEVGQRQAHARQAGQQVLQRGEQVAQAHIAQLRQRQAGQRDVGPGHARQGGELQAGPAEAEVRQQAREVEFEAGDVQPRQREDHLGQRQVRPVQAEIRQANTQLGPGQAQRTEVEVGQIQVQPGQAQQRQADLGQRQLRPVDVEPERAQARQVEAGQGRDAEVDEGEGAEREVDLGQVQRQVQAREIEGVEVEGQAAQAQVQPRHKRRDAVGLGQRGLAHLQPAGKGGLLIDGGQHHPALQFLQRKTGAAGRRAHGERGVGIGHREHPALLRLALHEGHLLAADAEAARERVAHSVPGQAEVEVGAESEEVVVLGGAEVEGEGTDLALDGFARGVEAEVQRADGAHAQPGQRAAVGPGQRQVAQVQHAGHAVGREHEAALDAGGRELDTTGGDDERGVLDADLDVLARAQRHRDGEVAVERGPVDLDGGIDLEQRAVAGAVPGEREALVVERPAAGGQVGREGHGGAGAEVGRVQHPADAVEHAGGAGHRGQRQRLAQARQQFARDQLHLARGIGAARLDELEPDVAVQAEQALTGLEAAVDAVVAQDDELVAGLRGEAVDELDVQRAGQRGQAAHVDAVVEGAAAGVGHGGGRGAAELDDGARGAGQRQPVLQHDQAGRVAGRERAFHLGRRGDQAAAGQRGAGADDERAHLVAAGVATELDRQAGGVDETLLEPELAVQHLN